MIIQPPFGGCLRLLIAIAIPKTAEERLYMLARGWLAYPVTPCAHMTTAEERLYKHTVANALQTGSPPKTKFPTAKPQPETV